VAWVPVDDPRDSRIAHFVGLRDRELARRVGSGGPGVFIAEGDIVAERAAGAGYQLRAVLVDATRADPLPRGVDAGVPIYAAAPAVLQRITGLGVHRGLLACFDRRPPRPATEVVAAARRVVVLERVSNPTNLGVILRSAAGLGMDAVLLDPTCSDPLYRRTSRVAMGEGYGFPWAWIPPCPAGWACSGRTASGSWPSPRTAAPLPSTSWRSTVPTTGASLGTPTGWRCCSGPRDRGCRPGRWPQPMSGPASPCVVGSIH
jgi:hypothetical protein